MYRIRPIRDAIRLIIFINQPTLSYDPCHGQTSISTPVVNAAYSLKAVDLRCLDYPMESCFYAIQFSPEWRGYAHQIPPLRQVSILRLVCVQISSGMIQ